MNSFNHTYSLANVGKFQEHVLVKWIRQCVVNGSSWFVCLIVKYLKDFALWGAKSMDFVVRRCGRNEGT